MIQIINTFNCNFHCLHCVHESSSFNKDFVKREDFINFCEGIKKWDPEKKSIYISGGEPTNHPDFIWQLNTLSEYFDTIIIPTNGVWATTPIFNEIKTHFLNSEKIIFQISETIFHKKQWGNNYSAQKAKELIESIGIRVSLIDRERIVYIGRAIKNRVGDPNSLLMPPCFQDKFFFDPCLLPSGEIASCHIAKCIIGKSDEDFFILEKRFLDYMNKKHQIKKDLVISKCYQCKYEKC